ncbi:hypothetical protein [Candidatus Methylocalor cossyra]|uniref:Uncharacterized protein n=1 Tax=Candidatus Methylocalor cossyra TaxID=3108543 RepID=A0ABM9NGD5_9GAMM
MNKHVGHDHSCHNRFRIIELDRATHSVVIQYAENDWLRGVERTQRFAWMDFLQGLMDGRFEIHAVG